MQDLTITIVQSALHWENIEANLEMFSEKLTSIEGPSDLIVLPEMFSTGFTMDSEKLAEEMGGRSMQWMAETAKKKNAVVAGSLVITENGKYFNRFVWMRVDGTYEVYNKRHLFRMMNEHKYYSAGDERLIVELNGWRICPLICYDLRFPVWSRNIQLAIDSTHKACPQEKKTQNPIQAYDVLLCVANWPEVRRFAWSQLLTARAIENQCYVLGENRVGSDGNEIEFSGDSAIVDAKGNIISSIQPFEENMETVTLSWLELETYREKFPQQLDADEFELLHQPI